MTPIVAGLCAAFAFAISVLVSARASRLVGPRATVTGVMLVGTAILVPVAFLATPLPPVQPGVFVLPLAAGAVNVAGLLLAYTAYTVGAVAVVSTIASTEGAIAAVISVLAGQQLAPGSGPILAIVAVGVVLAAAGGGQELEEGVRIGRARSLQAAGLAALAATMFGTGLFLTGRTSEALPIAWVLLPGRALGLLIVGIPLVLTRRTAIPRSALPLLVTCGTVEIVGLTAFAIGARVDIAVTSVLASMFAPIAAVAAYVLFRERLVRRQVAGIVLVVAGIGLPGALGASSIRG